MLSNVIPRRILGLVVDLFAVLKEFEHILSTELRQGCCREKCTGTLAFKCTAMLSVFRLRAGNSGTAPPCGSVHAFSGEPCRWSHYWRSLQVQCFSYRFLERRVRPAPLGACTTVTSAQILSLGRSHDRYPSIMELGAAMFVKLHLRARLRPLPECKLYPGRDCDRHPSADCANGRGQDRYPSVDVSPDAGYDRYPSMNVPLGAVTNRFSSEIKKTTNVCGANNSAAVAVCSDPEELTLVPPTS